MSALPQDVAGVPSPDPAPYDLAIVAISALSLVVLGLDTLLVTHPEAKRLLASIDLACCGIFFLDFLRRFHHAADRRRYLLGSGWIDLLSSVPALGLLRVGRLVRVIALIRLLRSARAVHALGHALARRPTVSAFVTAALICAATLLLGSVIILHVERTANANIQTMSDALWWAFVTITTVGYGDLYPVTVAGRATAAVLMVAGVGLFGTMSGLFASWLVRRDPREADQIAAMREEVRAVRELLQHDRR